MYRLSPTAQTQRNEIVAYRIKAIMEQSGHKEAARAAAERLKLALRLKFEQLGQTPGMGTPIEKSSYRQATLNRQGNFLIYYRQTGPKSIRVVAIKGAKQERPTIAQLEQAER